MISVSMLFSGLFISNSRYFRVRVSSRLSRFGR